MLFVFQVSDNNNPNCNSVLVREKARDRTMAVGRSVKTGMVKDTLFYEVKTDRPQEYSAIQPIQKHLSAF